MNYCIMTLDKIKTHGALVSRFHHDYRIANVENAYPEKLDENKYLIFQKNEQGEIQDYSQSWHERIDGIPYYQERMESQKRQVRSNAVLAYDIVLAYTPESNIDTDEWCLFYQWKSSHIRSSDFLCS